MIERPAPSPALSSLAPALAAAVLLAACGGGSPANPTFAYDVQAYEIGTSGGGASSGVTDAGSLPADSTATGSSSSSGGSSTGGGSSGGGSVTDTSSGSSSGPGGDAGSSGGSSGGPDASSGGSGSSGGSDAGADADPLANNPTCKKPSECLKHPDYPYCSILDGLCVECLIDLHCPKTHNCEQHQCKDVACKPGHKECKNGFLNICKPDGKSWEAKACPESLPHCTGGQCTLCLPGEKFCAKPPKGKLYSNVVLKCNSTGKDADFVLQCEGATVCIQGKCQLCVPGLKRCHNGRAEECSLNGTGWQVKDNCAAKDLACLGGLCVDPCGGDFKSNTNVGCDYWAVDLDNAQVPCGPKLCDAQNMQYSVIISNTKNKNAKVTISTGSGKFTKHLIPPKGLKVINLPDPAWGLPKPLNLDGTAISANSYRIKSSVPIVAYQFNPLANEGVFSNDASLLLPSNVMGTEYFAMSRQQNFSNLRGFLTVVGVQPGGTTVQVVPSCKTLPGKDMAGKSIPSTLKGQLLKVTLGEGEVLNLETNEEGGDLTGTWIVADAPIAVFSGSEASNVPDTNKCVKAAGAVKGACAVQGWPCQSNADCPVTCCADHLEEELFPVKAWGNTYVATKFQPRGKEPDVWRVLAAYDKTVVQTTPQQVPPKSLKKGEWLEFESTADFIVKASQPVMVGHFMASANAPNPNNDQCADKFSGTRVCSFYLKGLPAENKCVGANPTAKPPVYGKCSAGGWPSCLRDLDCPTQEPIQCSKNADCPNIKEKDDASIGDPAMVLTVATDRFLKSYVFLVPDKYRENFINIVAPTAAVVSLDGTPVAAAKFKAVSPEYKVVRLAVGPGKHQLVSDYAVGLIVYGWDRYVSYAYPGGAALK